MVGTVGPSTRSGKRDERPDGTYIATRCFCFWYIPLVPIAAYRVYTEDKKHYRIIEKVPLSSMASRIRLAMAVSIPLCLVLACLLWRGLVYGSHDVGEACSGDDCGADAACVQFQEGPVCTLTCESSADCVADARCDPTELASGGTAHICLEQLPMRASGLATVTQVSGALSGVAIGTRCRWEQRGSPGAAVETRWAVGCPALSLYGDGAGGYNPSDNPAWPEGTRVLDPGTTGQDGDPFLHVRESSIVIRDDVSGPLGAFEVTFSIP